MKLSQIVLFATFIGCVVGFTRFTLSRSQQLCKAVIDQIDLKAYTLINSVCEACADLYRQYDVEKLCQ